MAVRVAPIGVICAASADEATPVVAAPGAQLAQVASDVRGAVITKSGHNIALDNPAALAQAYLDFFASPPSGL